VGKKWPGDLPPNVRDGQDLMSLGALTVIITVFLALVGQGCPPREALAVTLALGLGATEVIKRLHYGRDGDSRGRR
jgi:hypothetical protein